jgi:beta-glucosidase
LSCPPALLKSGTPAGQDRINANTLQTLTIPKKMKLLKLTISSILASCCLVAAGQNPSGATKPAFLDQTLSVEKRVEDYMGRLTLKQKAQLLNHRGPTVTVEGFGLRSDQWNQCLHGVKWTEPTTMFPTSIALGATWDTDLIGRVATVISDEARAIYNGWKLDPGFRGEHKGLIYRSPVINISRNPYWGRINEIFSEDPYLTSRIGVSYVKGLQGDDPHYLKLASTLKHYAVNNVEVDRMKLNVEVPERMLYEYWLPHFRAAVVEGKAQSLMASYNAMNGTPNNINHLLLTDILKDKWGHEGFVVSDLGGVRTMVEGHHQRQMSYEQAVGMSLMAGCDFSDTEFEQYIPDAYFMGYVTMERLDDALRRVLTTRFRLGEFDEFSSVPYSKISPDIIGAPAHRNLALETARKSIVLLKNDRGILPLTRSSVKSVAVIGPRADIFNHGNYAGIAKDPILPLQGIINEVGPDVRVTYVQGAQIAPRLVRRGRPIPPRFDSQAELKKAVEAARASDVAILFVGTTSDIEVEGRDRTTLRLPGGQEELIRAVCAVNKKTIVVLMSAGPVAIPDARRAAPAILQAWWPGEEGGTAIADVIFGNYNPAGRLPYTMYASDAQVPPTDEYDVTKGFTYMYLKDKPLWAFGHGLSYTSFAYSDLALSSARVSSGDVVTVNCTVRNTGKRDGEEVVQLYVRDLKSSVVRPVRELRGFQRVALAAGEQKNVTLKLPVNELNFWDDSRGDFFVEPGEVEILIGAASDDIRLRTTLTVN